MFENMAPTSCRNISERIPPPALGPPGDHRVLSPDGKPLPTKDGYICNLGEHGCAGTPFFDAIGRPELKDRSALRTVAQRVQHTKEYFHIRATSLGGRRRRSGSGSSTGGRAAFPLQHIASLIDDPHFARGHGAEEEHPTEGPRPGPSARRPFSGAQISHGARRRVGAPARRGCRGLRCAPRGAFLGRYPLAQLPASFHGPRHR